MTERERFKCVVGFGQPDYWPLVTVSGLGYIHEGGLLKLHKEGLPESVNNLASWCKYWGQCTFDHAGSIGIGAPPLKETRWIEGDYELIRCETGALTRQPVDNSVLYCMPEYIEFSVRDRQSWEKYRELTAPKGVDQTRMARFKERFADRTRPLAIGAGGTWGIVRNLMGPEHALLAIYDDPELVHDMIRTMLDDMEKYIFPVIRQLKPEIVTMWEDFCYNHGMLISPDSFREFCGPYYQRVAEVAHDCGADLVIVDSDGKVGEYCLLLEEYGFNGCWPMEQVCGNPLLEYRAKQPSFIFAGGIEKEIVNTGNAHMIENELIPKIPEMLKKSGFFPMFDHAIQTLAGFDELCRCMTRLHQICGSDELGDFPRKD